MKLTTYVSRSVLVAAILSLQMAPRPVAAQEPTVPAGQQIVSGKIKVNGKSVAPGFTIASDSMVETAKGSSAVVSLGKLGRVEVLPDSRMKITFDSNSMTIAVESGGARILKSEGATAKVTTRDGEIVASTPLAASFTVDTVCGDTVVNAEDATVELHANNEVQMILPGSKRATGKAIRRCKPRTKTSKSVIQ
jgi:hypothetical protein